MLARSVVVALALVPTALSGQASAARPWSLRVSAVISGGSHGSEPAGYKVYSGVGLEAGVGRALSDALVIELSLRTESREVTGPAVGGGEEPLGSIEVLPVHLTAGWRPLGGRDSTLRPVVGVGVSYTDVWEESGALDSSESTPSWKPLILIGSSIRLSDRVALDLSARWNPWSLDVQDFRPTNPEVSIDPLALGVGVGVGL